MKKQDNLKEIEDYIVERMKRLEPQTTIGNGSLLAEAAATVWAYGMVKIKASKAEIKKRSENTYDITLLKIIDGLAKVLSGDSRQFVSVKDEHQDDPQDDDDMIEISTSYLQGIRLDGQRFVAIMGQKGLYLHRFYENYLHPNRPGEKYLKNCIISKAKNLPKMDIKDLAIEDIEISQYSQHLYNLKVPMRAGRNKTYIEIRRTICLELMSYQDLSDLADYVIKTRLNQWLKRDEIDVLYDEIYNEISPIINKARNKKYTFDFIGIKTAEYKTANTHRIDKYAVFKVLNAKGEESQDVYEIDRNNLLKYVQNLYQRQSKIEKTATVLQASKDVMTVDDIALSAIRYFNFDLDVILERMKFESSILLNTKRSGKKMKRLRLSWKDGVIWSRFNLTPDLLWSRDKLVGADMETPETVIQSLKGKSIEALIDHPIFRCNAIIKNVKSQNSYRRHFSTFSVKAGATVIDLREKSFAA